MKHGPKPHVDSDALVRALERGAKVKWDHYEASGRLRLPGDGEWMFVKPWEVEYAYRQLVHRGAR
jgi:hypothetical protein